MYQNKVFNLYVSKSKIRFRDNYGNYLENKDIVGDICIPIYKSDNTGKYQPDFYISGFYRPINKGSHHEFIIDNRGTDILFITGVPNNTSVNLFKFKNTKFTSFTQDNVKGVLFQVLKKAPIYVGITKSQGIMQF